jgi:mono/diheme cytochrome c family protein
LNGPSVIPPAYGLSGVRSVTYTGDGANLAYWNRYVAVTQMHGHGSWTETRVTPPENVQNPPDMVTDKLAALQAYQLSIARPAPATGSFDASAAARGRGVFEGAGKCASCHAGATFTDAPAKLHSPSEVVSEPEPNGAPSLASRSATKMYRSTPLRGLWQHPPYFHNGVATTLDAVVDLYNTRKALNLTPQQKSDLVQYLRTL